MTDTVRDSGSTPSEIEATPSNSETGGRPVRIPLADNVDLAAELRLPDGPGPFPTIVSYIPYHKDDFMGAVFERDTHIAFVDSGYATVLVDLRGTGGSTGRPNDAVDAQDGRDGAAIVEWAAEQEWSDGNIGMWGLSYGGITSLKTAAEHPKHLKAIIPMMASLDFYDDWAYPGGCRNMLGALGVWASFMVAMQLLPPMELDEDGLWRERWNKRLEAVEPYLLPWEENPDRNQYWLDRATDPSDVSVPAFFIGGWRDIFPGPMIEAFEGAVGPRKLLMGPWEHVHPEESAFEPVDHVADMVAWWDRWLRDDAVEGEPDQGGVQFYSQGEGSWLTASDWPPPGSTEVTSWLGAGHVLDGDIPSESLDFTHTVDPTVGTSAGLWDPLGLDAGRATDQTPDDLRSLAFTSPPYSEPVRIAGAPQAILNVCVDEGEELSLVAKLCDVAPDGSSSLVTTGVLNARHRVSASQPVDIEVGKDNEYVLTLYPTAYLIKAGHRLRLSITGADFPRIWPTATNPTFRVLVGPEAQSRVVLPVLPDSGMTEFVPERPDAEKTICENIIDGEPRWTIERDEISNEVTVTTGGRYVFNTPSQSAKVELDHQGSAKVRAARPDGATVRGRTKMVAITAMGNRVEVMTSTIVTNGGASISARVTVDGATIFDRDWSAARRSSRSS